MVAKPQHEIRLGTIVVRITRKRSKSGASYSMNLVRLYRNGDQWKESTRLTPSDIPLARLVLDEAHSWVLLRETEST